MKKYRKYGKRNYRKNYSRRRRGGKVLKMYKASRGGIRL